MMLSIRLPKEVEDRLTELAEKTGRTKTSHAREAILEHLDEMEDKYLAITRTDNGRKRFSLDELEKNLDVDS